MRLDELKARLVGKTITDIDLEVDEHLGAILIGRISLDDGTKVVLEGHDTGQVWVDYLLDASGDLVNTSPDEADVVEDEDDYEDEPEIPVPDFRDVLNDEERQAVIDQCPFLDNSDRLFEMKLVHRYDNEPWPARDPEAKCITRWFELEGPRDGMGQIRRAIIGFGPSKWFPGKLRMLQGTRLRDDWSRIPTNDPK